ncbi:hypothetical protein NDU88_003612 [Pleurodeles waltl]|uniref:Uncharacterized protein n=1 Tax=Pleurodeles waltl TaxID=8319 RepID=A0AAV7MSY5_PLEWA|nr:hypothetical protein NDU88_003612 [Pleurodeles waltl]
MFSEEGLDHKVATELSLEDLPLGIILCIQAAGEWHCRAEGVRIKQVATIPAYPAGIAGTSVPDARAEGIQKVYCVYIDVGVLGEGQTEVDVGGMERDNGL